MIGRSTLSIPAHFILTIGFALSISASPTPRIVYTYDARPLNRLNLGASTNATRLWDTMHVLSAAQGLANRPGPKLYLFYCAEFGVDTDTFWFNWLRNEDGWLKAAEVRPLATLEEVLDTFSNSFQGLVVYDPAVPATSNLGSTAAGVEDLLPVRYDPSPGSLFQLLAHQRKMPVKLWLVNPDGTSMFTGSGRIPGTDEPSTGSAKGDVYRWALRRYVQSGRCAPGIAAYYLDAFWIQHPRRAGPTMHTLSNHDYFIGRKAFFFDLSTWGDEQPTDDPGQPLGLDRKLFLEVLRGLHDLAPGSLTKVGGFTPWPYKYTSHASPRGKYDGVPTEWEFARLISQFNGYMEADAAGLAAIANASFFAHYPLAVRYEQPNPKPSTNDWQKRGFVTPQGKVASKLYLAHYVGDYDAPSWLYKAVPKFFPDPNRGKVPLGWAFDPNLADRAPQALAYAYKYATTNDFFIAGDSGAGYLNPRSLSVRPDSGLPPALEAWRAHCARLYAKWDMTITGFILDGSGGGSTQTEFAAYQSFSPAGAGTHFEKSPGMRAGMPTCPERDLPDEVGKAADVISQAKAARAGQPGFFWARSILKSPKWYADLSAILRERFPEGEVEVVDPYTFFGLIKMQNEQ